MPHHLRHVANCSMLFTELPLLERPAAARAAGFAAVELWWPWPEPVPDPREVDALVEAVRDAQVRLVGLNLFAGDLAAGDCGVLSVPGRTDALVANLAVVQHLARELGIEVFNALWGRQQDGRGAEQQALGLANLRRAGEVLGSVGGTVLLEPLSGREGYPVLDTAQAVALLERAGVQNAGVLCDLYHLAANGVDLDLALVRDVGWIRHVQVADHPGRGAPGTGTLDLDRHLGTLVRGGYTGYLSLEYTPAGATGPSLDFLPRSQRR